MEIGLENWRRGQLSSGTRVVLIFVGALIVLLMFATIQEDLLKTVGSAAGSIVPDVMGLMS